jgi:short subunit dehydrogenase
VRRAPKALSDSSNSSPLLISIFGSNDTAAGPHASCDVPLSRTGEMMMDSTKGTAMVTGALSGMGTIYADRLARRGYLLVLVDRDCERLNDRARRLTEETGRTVNVVAVDLGETEDIGKIETLLRRDDSISCW